MKNYDVVVSGGGPSGSVIGSMLSKNGFRVLIIEKQKHPRWKPCGEGISQEGINLFKKYGFYKPIKNLLWNIDKISFLINNEIFLSKKYDKPIAHTFDRSIFDDALFKHAQKFGAETHENEKVKVININREEVRVKTSQNEYRARIIICADGINGICGKHLFRPWKKDEITLCHVARYEIPNNSEINDSMMEYYIIKGGYGWIFPKVINNQLILNIGLGKIENLERNSLESFKNYLRLIEKIKKVELVGKEIDLKIWSHPIPIKGPSRNTYSNKCLLVGDAGGFVNPLTGGGLKYGVLSAVHAAETTSQYLNNEIETLEVYREKWIEDYGKIFDESLKIREVFCRYSPTYMYNYFVKNQHLKERFIEKFLS